MDEVWSNDVYILEQTLIASIRARNKYGGDADCYFSSTCVLITAI